MAAAGEQRGEVGGAAIGRWADGLDALHGRLGHCCGPSEVRARARRYLAGLLGAVARRNGWQLAEHLGERHPRGVQRLLDAARWDADAVREDLRAAVVEHLGDARGVLVVDETGFLKKGTQSVGVARQSSGTAGRTENCQVGVVLADAGRHGRAFLDRALDLPRAWADDPARRAETGVPETVRFATKGALAKALLRRAFAGGVPAAWVVGDTVDGTDPGLRPWLEAERRASGLAVPKSQRVWLGERQASAQTAVARVPAEAGTRRSAGDVSQGPRWYAWAWIPLAGEGPPGWGRWRLARRSVRDPRELAYSRGFAPGGTPLAEAVRAAGSRWVIEAGFERAKGEVGLDQYEVRRLLHVLTAPPERHGFLLRWSHWRRTHQAVARRSHIAA